LQVPCRFNGGVVVHVDRFRASAGGWVRMLFKNVNGSPLTKVEFSKVSERCVCLQCVSNIVMTHSDVLSRHARI
jgi:hypothetical protein